MFEKQAKYNNNFCNKNFFCNLLFFFNFYYCNFENIYTCNNIEKMSYQAKCKCVYSFIRDVSCYS